MSVINNLSTIPFYNSKEEQDFRLWYAYGEKYCHCVPSDFLVPFSFCVPLSEGDIDDVLLYNSCDDSNVPISLEDNGLIIEHFSDYSRITYRARHTTDLELPKGMYYLCIKVALQSGILHEYYSDVMCIRSRAEVEKKVCIEWKNIDSIEYSGGSIPSEPYKNILYLDTTIGMPEYTFTEDGEERNGHFFPIKQISEKTYKFGIIAPEYLCDAMRTIRMADSVVITDNLGRRYDVEHFEMGVSWAEQGHYAIVDCSFQTDTIVKKIGKAYNI